jgi:bacterioferritin-associated ferredoxin
MRDDEELCLCFHVTKRKVLSYLRVHRPQRPSQLSECFGAGTGCGWCRPLLKKLWEKADASLPDSATHAAGRQVHLRQRDAEPPDK